MESYDPNANAGTICNCILLVACIIASIFFSISCSENLATKEIVVFEQSLILENRVAPDELGFLDGMKNPFIIYGSSIVQGWVEAYHDYIDGFSSNIIMNILWAVFGLIFNILKAIVLIPIRIIVTAFVALFQAAKIAYYFGYLLGIYLVFVPCLM